MGELTLIYIITLFLFYKGPGARAGERSLGRGAKRIVLIPRDRPIPAAQSDHFTKRAHHKASASQSERITKRARHKASMRRCTVSPLSRHNAVQRRGELFVTADLLLPSDCHCVARPLKTGRYPSTGADRDRGGPRPGRTDRGGQDTPRDTPADQVTKVRRDVPRATRRSSLFLAFVDDVQQSQGDGIN